MCVENVIIVQWLMCFSVCKIYNAYGLLRRLCDYKGFVTGWGYKFNSKMTPRWLKKSAYDISVEKKRRHLKKTTNKINMHKGVTAQC